MQLNKRDLYIYKKFLIQMKRGFDNIYLDKYAPIIQKFIEKYYVSDDKIIDDLGDFIQYALMITIQFSKYTYNFYSKSGYLILRLKKLYQKMLKMKMDEHLNINPSYTLDDDEIFFKLLIEDIESTMLPNKITILEDYINGVKQMETAKKINKSFQSIQQQRKQILRSLIENEKFMDYYQTKKEPVVLKKVEEKK